MWIIEGAADLGPSRRIEKAGRGVFQNVAKVPAA
jgi:hypothetical protein